MTENTREMEDNTREERIIMRSKELLVCVVAIVAKKKFQIKFKYGQTK